MTKKEFIETIEKLQKYYNKKLSDNDLRLYWNEFKTTNTDRFKKAANNLIQKNKFFPKITEIKYKLEDKKSFDNINLNSSYWYKNLRDSCDSKNQPYYDITKGVNNPLPPFKN